ncbi:hypothetical protein ETAA8_53720 [Anatilimnocola aggregata]|uniref:Uncharacterized protein n=1 Tax=Anatilimnocola aggregata TaxID=2528021 RepID=A0A517YJ52_9BACT|nr:hypothetical protein [Anatilimnocola aggregata]QDU30253.1 hypothetical protein ETAA8_53720 [Anatilimnocola aggregata]
MNSKSLELRRTGRILLDQELWCLGKDIESGNSLIHFGCERISPPRNLKTLPSIYVWQQADVTVLLRGFGVGFANRLGSIFINRYSFIPALVSSPAMWRRVWRIEDLELPPTSRSRASIGLKWQLAAESCRWMAIYEQWIAATRRQHYRLQLLREREQAKLPSLGTANVAKVWKQLATACDQHALHWQAR